MDNINKNKWNIVFGICVSPYALRIEFHIGIFKIIKMPGFGCCISKENIKGFWFHREFKGFFINLIKCKDKRF